jgi:hypothetical protein
VAAGAGGGAATVGTAGGATIGAGDGDGVGVGAVIGRGAGTALATVRKGGGAGSTEPDGGAASTGPGRSGAGVLPTSCRASWTTSGTIIEPVMLEGRMRSMPAAAVSTPVASSADAMSTKRTSLVEGSLRIRLHSS